MLKVIFAIISFGIIGYFAFYFFSHRSSPEEDIVVRNVTIQKDFGKVLIIYYSLSGETKKVAEIIKDKLDGTLYEIKVDKPYSSSFSLYYNAAKQLKSKKYPQLVNDVPDIDSYDHIFIGSPVWWYTMSPPLYSFLLNIDFKGKKVIPFATCGGGIGDFFADFKAHAKNADILEGKEFIKVSKQAHDILETRVSLWLSDI